MAQTEIVVRFLPIVDRSHELEVAGRSFLDSSEEIQGITPSGFVELRLEVLKFRKDSLFFLG